MTYENYPTYVISRILEKSQSNTNGCIEYRPGLLRHKYGLTSITINRIRKSIPVHRAMYMAVNKCFDLPRNQVIRHKCDNPRCVNIDHLEMGTPKDNMRDCIERGRKAKKYKAHTRQRKLTNEQILDIRNGIERPSYYVWKYGISNGYVSKLRSGRAKTLIR